MIKATQRFFQTDLILCSNLRSFLRSSPCACLGPGAEDSGANSEGSLLSGFPAQSVATGDPDSRMPGR